MGVLVAVTFGVSKRRAARVAESHDTALALAVRLAGSVPPETLIDKLAEDGELLAEIAALGVFRLDDTTGEPTLRNGLGKLAEPGPATLERALAEVRRGGEVFSPGDASVGDAVVVLAPLEEEQIRQGKRASAVYIELAPIDIDPVAASRAIFLVIVAAGLLLIAVTWIIVDRVVARPLHEVALGAQRVGEGDYSMLVPGSEADDEIQKVISAFNSMMLDLGAAGERMQDQIGEALRRARHTQESLIIAQRLAATGTLAAGIAHEVNNPLGGMLNAVHALRTKDMTPAKRREYLLLVENGLERVKATVSKILTFTPHKVAPQPVDLEDVVRPVLALTRHRIEKQGVDVDLDFAAQPAAVFADPYELQQAVLNVVLNALDALEEAPPEQPHILIRTTVHEDEVRLLVRDNGPGMDEEQLTHAFDLFYTTKEQGKGSGLGLGTVHQIIADHGGRVEMERAAGKTGMDVVFVLPRLERSERL
jgi:signal transduction histidine kinase